MTWSKIKTKIVEHRFTFLYTIVVLLLVPAHIDWKYRILFFGYAMVIYGIFYLILSKNKQRLGINAADLLKNRRWFIYILIFALVFLLLIRLLPFIRFGEAPLGYDTGFYLQQFRTNQVSLASDRAYYLSLVPYNLLGLEPIVVINFVYVLSQLLIAGSLYFLFTSFKTQYRLHLASIAILLFATSVTQFYAYWWMFGQQMMAMGFLFLTIGLFIRRSPLLIFTAIVGALIHTPTFAVFAICFGLFLLIYIIQSLIRRKPFDRYLLYLFGFGFLTTAIILVAKWGIVSEEFKQFWQYKGLVINAPFWKIYQLSGSFIDVGAFHKLSLYLSPFVILGIIHPKIWSKVVERDPLHHYSGLFLYVMLAIVFVIIISPVIYHTRSIIIFDFVIIIFATPAIFLFMQYFARDLWGRILVGLFIVALLSNVAYAAWNQKPQISPAELDDIKAVKAIVTDEESRFMTTSSSYTPWVHGFGGMPFIGPAYGDDKWGLNKWMTFWQGNGNAARYELLNQYPYPLYIFVGDKQHDNMHENFIKNNEAFKKINDHVWFYDREYVDENPDQN